MPASGASWPFSMLKQVRLARAVRADQGQKLAGVDGEGHVVDGLHAAERLVQAFDLQDRRAHARGLAPALRQRLEAADQALREEQHHRQDHPAHDGAPVLGAAGDLVLQPGEDAAPANGPGQRLDAAQQHHDQPVDRLGDRDGRGRDAALGEGVDRAGQSGEGAGERRRPSIARRAGRCRWPRRAAANRGRRAGRSRRARTARAKAARCRPAEGQRR